MIKASKISVSQLFFALFISRILVTMTYTPSLFGVSLLPTDILTQNILALLMDTFLVIPLFFSLKNDSDVNLLERSRAISPLFAKISAVIFYIYFIYPAITATSIFELFATSVLFPESDFRFFILIIILACCYFAYLGIESIGRTAQIILFVVLIITGFAYIGVSNEFELTNFTPPLYEGFKKPLLAAVFSISRTPEVATLAILSSRVRGNIKKGLIVWTILLNIYTLSIMILVGGVLGQYANNQIFPVYSLMVLAEIGFLERIDVVLTSAWIIFLFIKLGLLIYAARSCLDAIFKSEKKNIYILITGILIFVPQLFFTNKVAVSKLIINGYLYIILFTFCLLIFPTVILIFEKLKKGGK